jgi:hypothetical protein
MNKKQNSVLTIPVDGRSLCVGRTGSGKSVLVEQLMWRYLAEYKNTRVLICDTKKRFRCEWQVNGVSASGLYKKLAPNKGTYLPGAYTVPLDVPFERSLREIYKHSRIAVVQSLHLADWYAIMECARVFYEKFDARVPRLLIPDELSDFYEVKKQGGIFWQVARTGRELNVALLGGCQRPVYIPRVVLTEVDRFYLFQLDNRDDMKTMFDVGIPKGTPPPEIDHSFFYWNKFEGNVPPSGQVYKLEL